MMMMMLNSSNSNGSNKKPNHYIYRNSYYHSQTAENRWAAFLCICMTLTACFLMRYRAIPLTFDMDDGEVVNVQRLEDRGDPSDPTSCAGLLARLDAAQPKIQLVAIDFDKTILDIHTWGRWKQRTSLLIPHVRPSFQCFMTTLLEQNTPVAITTFSTQKDLIQKVLTRSLQAYDDKQQQEVSSSSVTTTTTTTDVAAPDIMIPATPNPKKDKAYYTLPVLGGDDWVKGHSKGKQSQLKLAMKHYNQHKNPETDPVITPAATLLIDDDANNIKVARKDGYQTLLYVPIKVHGSR